MIEPENLKLAMDGKYTDFSDTIKGELMTKLASHSDSVAFINAIDNIQKMKDSFAEINKHSEA